MDSLSFIDRLMRRIIFITLIADSIVSIVSNVFIFVCRCFNLSILISCNNLRCSVSVVMPALAVLIFGRVLIAIFGLEALIINI